MLLTKPFFSLIFAWNFFVPFAILIISLGQFTRRTRPLLNMWHMHLSFWRLHNIQVRFSPFSKLFRKLHKKFCPYLKEYNILFLPSKPYITSIYKFLLKYIIYKALSLSTIVPLFFLNLQIMGTFKKIGQGALQFMGHAISKIGQSFQGVYKPLFKHQPYIFKNFCIVCHVT